MHPHPFKTHFDPSLGQLRSLSISGSVTLDILSISSGAAGTSSASFTRAISLSQKDSIKNKKIPYFKANFRKQIYRGYIIPLKLIKTSKLLILVANIISQFVQRLLTINEGRTCRIYIFWVNNYLFKNSYVVQPIIQKLTVFPKNFVPPPGKFISNFLP